MRPGTSVSVAVITALGVVLSGAAGTPASAQAVLEVSVQVAPTPFSPNGDGRKDVATITAEVSLPSEVTISVLTTGGEVVRTWPTVATGAEPVVVQWNGRTEGERVADGPYTARAIARIVPEELEAEAIEAEDSAGVVVDTIAPRIRRPRIRPDPVTSEPRVAMRFIARDRSPRLRAHVIVQDAVRRVTARAGRIRHGTGRITWPARYRNGKRLFPGNYRSTLRLTDAAGNVSKPARLRWRVHRAVPARVFTRLSAGKRVALTFDDCHLNTAWPRILGILRRLKVKATFFCPGGNVLARPDLARRTIRGGHVAGAHAYDHANLAGQSTWFTESRLRKDAQAWWKAAGVTSAPYMRPPYGAYDRNVLRAAGASGHPRVMMWDVDPRDWTLPGSGTVASRVLSQSRRGSVILLHTLHMTADALPSIISGLRARGLEPVTLPKLFAAAGMR